MVSPPLHVPRWLCNEQIDAGTRRWAVEGLAYLTFDADVKEEFVEDEAALKALFQLSRVAPWFCSHVGTLSRIRVPQVPLADLGQQLSWPQGVWEGWEPEWSLCVAWA